MATKTQMKRLVPKSGRAPDPKKTKGLPRVKKASKKYGSYKIPKTPSNGIGVGGN